MSKHVSYITTNVHVRKSSRRRLQNFLIALYDLWDGGRS